MITVPTSPEEAYRKFDALAAQHIEGLRKLTKSIQDARSERNTEAIKESLKVPRKPTFPLRPPCASPSPSVALPQEYDDALERYIPVLMGQARIYWDMGNYSQVEVLFRQAGEFCSEHDTWKLNVGHMFFMQAKYREVRTQGLRAQGGDPLLTPRPAQAIHYYEPLVNRHLQNDNIIDVTAIVLANLCVSYIMTSQNERVRCRPPAAQSPPPPAPLTTGLPRHRRRSSCARSRTRSVASRQTSPTGRCSTSASSTSSSARSIAARATLSLAWTASSSLSSPSNASSPPTPGARTGGGPPIGRFLPLTPALCCCEGRPRFYAKRCLLSMGETLAKNMIMISDESFARILDFLDQADRVGKDIRTVIDTGSEEAKVDPAKHNVSFEARQIKRLYLRLRSNAE